jgi:Lrp/AsnC family transcriptional regulator
MNKILELDSIDRKILGLLQQDATLAVHDIGQAVGLSTNPCWRRIKRMEDAGIIERRVAILNPVSLGLGTTLFVTIKTSTHNAEWLDMFRQGIAAIPEIVECHRMSGDIDYLLKVIVADIGHYDRVYQRLIADIPGLSDVSSAFSMERLKFGTALPI